jgi:hypothetical protein
VPPDRVYEAVLVVGANLVAAVAADCLASEHVAADNPGLRLAAR